MAQIAILLAVLVSGYIAVTHSLAQALRTKAPERAYALSSYDGRITAYLSAKLSGPNATSEQRAGSDRLARQALRQDPTAVAAAATLGLNAQMRGETEAARRYFGYSDGLSRRDLRTRLWMIEDAVAREDIPDALRNYDIALRTSRTSPELLYPVLTSAISDPAIRAELAKLLTNRPIWTDSFVHHAAVHGEDALASARLFEALGGVNVPIPAEAKARVIDRMIADKNYDAAWAYYVHGQADLDRRRSRYGNFAANPASPSSFDWVPLGGNAGVSTTIEGANGDGRFDFSAPSSVGGALLQQLQLLPRGEYVLEGRSVAVEQVDSALPYWVLLCVDGEELGRVTVPNSSLSNGQFRGRFIVPAGCAAQYLRLVARPSNAVGGLSGQIEQVVLRPAS